MKPHCLPPKRAYAELRPGVRFLELAMDAKLDTR